MSAVDRWKAMIQEEHNQSERMRAAAPAGDFWRGYAAMFRAAPHRTGDAVLDRLLQEVSPGDTVIDVGAGGGRMALPLALHCRHVVAVEPSPSMGDVLEQQTQEHSIDNITLVQSSWEGADVDPGDFTVCCHVLYTIQDIGPFLRKLESHVKKRVLIVLYNAAPQSQTYPLWREIHGQERIPLPSLPQLTEVLQELRIDADVEMLPPQLPRGYDSLEQAADQLAHRLYLTEGTPEWAKLMDILPQRLERVERGFQIRDAAPLRPGLVSWSPERE